jgi:hypothetical protein
MAHDRLGLAEVADFDGHPGSLSKIDSSAFETVPLPGR